MGGLGSGRTRRHICIDDCLTIDTAWLRKQKLLNEPGSGFRIEWKKWTETNFATRKEHVYFVQAFYLHGEDPTLTLQYQVTLTYSDHRPKQERSYTETITLESTPCNYGGARWWFVAPCCGNRARVLYINPKRGDLERMTPQCRTCLDLHYASQMQSYIERHKTYERYLLTNYGYTWAEMEYHCLREHYLEITPEIEYLRQRSILQVRMRLLRLLTSSTRIMLRTHMHNIRSLRSEEDRQVYMDHVRKQQGEAYGLDLVHLLEISTKMERTARQSSSEVFDEAYSQMSHSIAQSLHTEEEAMDSETQQAIEEAALEHKMNMRYLLAYKEQVEEDLERLEQLRPAA